MKQKVLFLILTFFIALGSATSIQAQRRALIYLPKFDQEPYHFGFLIAFNTMSYTIKTVENYQNQPLQLEDFPNNNFALSPTDVRSIYVINLETRQSPGFCVGIIGSKRLGRYFDLRFSPTLSFGERSMDYYTAVEKINDEIGHPSVIQEPFKKDIFSTFAEFPLHIKYRSKRLNNVGAYLISGINPKLDLASQKSNKIDIMGPDGEPISIINNLVTRRFDCAAEIGAGFDVYNQWFKFGVEVKMSYGILNIVKGDAFGYTKPIDQLRNKMFQVSFTFE